MHSYVLLEVLKRVLGSMAEGIQACRVKMTGWHMVREQGCRRQRMVRREPLQWVGQHGDCSPPLSSRSINPELYYKTRLVDGVPVCHMDEEEATSNECKQLAEV